MGEVVCIQISVYEGALTRGKTYAVLALDSDERQCRIKGDNGRARWFPLYCFASDGERAVPTLLSFTIDDPIDDAFYSVAEVSVWFSDRSVRWCTFATPRWLADHGDPLADSESRYLYGNRCLVITTEISQPTVEKVLKHMDDQGQLEDCTYPLAVGATDQPD